MHHGQIDLDADPIARGGRGYDKWWIEYELEEPRTTHKSYPKNGKAKTAHTARALTLAGFKGSGQRAANRSPISLKF